MKLSKRAIKERLDSWLGNLFYRNFIKVREEERHDGYRFYLYTSKRCYSVVALTSNYLGCTVGDIEGKGTDLRDGDFCLNTWVNILCDILCMELVSIETFEKNREDFTREQFGVNRIRDEV